MKRLIGIFALFTIVLSGCDDGDLVFEDIDFSEVNAQRCANKIYKLNGAEALILKIGSDENSATFTDAFPLEPTETGTVQNIAIDNSVNKVVYRLYDGDVTNPSICGAIPAAFPLIVEEWEATSGDIEITTTARIEPNTATGFEGGQKITGYQNNIVFRNITFEKTDGSTQVYDVFPFGVFEVTAPVLNFNFGALEVQKCPSTSRVFKITGLEAIDLKLDPALLDTSSLGEIKTGVLDDDNVLTYYQFAPATAIDATFFCNGAPPVTPTQIWTGVPGVPGMSGVIEVVSQELPGGNGFSHTIRLKKVTFKKGRNEFLLADDYLLGELNITD